MGYLDPPRRTGEGMDIEILRGEIERLFSLDELTALSRDLLGLDPDEVGGTNVKASFARALTDRCSELDALDALVDAVIASRSNADPRLRDLNRLGFAVDETLAGGRMVGPFLVNRRLGEGGSGIVYSAEHEGQSIILKVLHREASRDSRALHRFLTVTRLISRVSNASLPRSLTVGHLREIDAYYVAYENMDGEPLSARVKRDGPIHIQEARVILRNVLEALASLHARGIAHGNLKLENIIVSRSSQSPSVLVVDGGVDRLRLRTRAINGHTQYLHTLGSPKTIAPEQIRGSVAQPRADVYAFGSVLYEVLTGQPVFSAATAVDAAVAHLIEDPKPPSDAAPRGWIAKDLDRFVLALLSKEPSGRPRDASVALEQFETLDRGPTAGTLVTITEEDLETRIQEVLAKPEDDAAALRLESAAQEGGDSLRIAGAFVKAAEATPAWGMDAFALENRKNLLFRAARLYVGANEKQSAEDVYKSIIEIDATDDIAQNALLQVRRSLGKFDDLVEMLISRCETATSRVEKVRLMGEIGRIYAFELEDKAQALVAYTQTFCEDPETDAYADEVERLAGSNLAAWNEATSILAEASAGDLGAEQKVPLLSRLGRWY